VFIVEICFAIHVKNSLKSEGMRGKNIKSKIWNLSIFNFLTIFSNILLVMESTTVKTEITEDYTTQETTTTPTPTLCFGNCTFQKCGWIGDGICDDDANTFDCNFDGGDCCGPNVNTGACTGSQICIYS
jgi:hypothetical protein